jgi:hypothetical protein
MSTERAPTLATELCASDMTLDDDWETSRESAEAKRCNRAL